MDCRAGGRCVQAAQAGSVAVWIRFAYIQGLIWPWCVHLLVGAVLAGTLQALCWPLILFGTSGGLLRYAGC